MTAANTVFFLLTYLQTIKKDHPTSTDECFVAFLHEHLQGDGDHGLKRLLKTLRSEAVGRAAVADDLEKLIETEQLW